MGGCWVCDGTGVLDPMEALRRIVHDLDELIGHSDGVAGLHGNGDVAPWDDLTDGPYSAWLGSIHVARAAVEGKDKADA